MTALLWRARNGLFVTAIGLMLVSLLAPAVTLADTSLSPGSAAVVAGTNGDGVSLHSDMSTDAPVLQVVPEGTPLQILDGPLTAADGSAWYSVSVNGTTGYVAAAFVSSASGNGDAQGSGDAQGDATAATEPAATEAPQEPVSGPAASTVPWKQPIAYGVVNDNSGQGAPADGIVCRADVSTSAAQITQVYLGDTVEITGQQIQSEGLAWFPVNCAGVGGFIDANFIQVNSPDQTGGDAASQDQTDQNAQEQTDQNAQEAATEAPTEVVTEAPTDVVTEAPAEVETAAPAEVETVAPTEAPADVQTGDQQAADEQTQAPDQQTQDQTDTQTEAPVENTPEVAVTEVATQAPSETTDPADAPATDAPATEAPATEAPATDAPAADVPAADEQATVAPTEAQTEPATDTTETTETEGATVEATAPATAAPTEEKTAERPATDTADAPETTDSTPAATVAPTEANATVAATQPAEAGRPAEVTATAETTEPAKGTERATQSPHATQPAKETAAATKTATQEATSTSAQHATATAAAPTKDAETSTPAAKTPKGKSTPATVPTQVMTTEKATPAVDLSQSIGSAEVKGTNGDGVRCRVSPADGAATITVLAEGTKVAVMGMPSNGWLPVACGDQIGYANLQYMWQGGAVQGDFSSGDTGGTVKVQGTGNGLNCRTGPSTDNAVITVLFDGTSLVIRGAPRGNWLPVTCAGRAGYVYIAYVSAPQGGTSGSTSAAGTATVTGTGGDGLRCRTGASTGSAIITVLADGTRVTTRGAASNGWVPVICGGQNGYISAQYATVGGSSSGSTSGSGGSVVVTGTGNGLNCRTGPSTSYGVITVVFDGTTLKVRGAATNGWIPVVCGGRNGYVSGDWVKSSGGSSGSTGTTVTGSATVTGTGGDGVRCRTGASTSNATITVVGEGQKVSLRGSASNGWQPVVCAGQNGYIYAQYLTTGSSSSSGSSSGSTGGLSSGAHARTTDALNLRYEPSLGAGVATVAPAGTVVLITGGATNGYYPVDWDGLKGYMAGDYLVKTSAALSQRGGSGAPGTSPSSGGSSATGNAIVDYAMGYLGYPYVWATHGPASFDCSGFVYWVVLHVLGRNIGTGLWTQVAAGTPVSRSALQPGDIVFFQNTYEPGLSHDGIYIGGGKFIHAENETTGVKISDLGSTYYSSRWYGAVRLT